MFQLFDDARRIARLQMQVNIGVTACSTNRDCSYNGRCVSAVCECSPQWHGRHCEGLRVMPARKDGGYRSPHTVGNASSWGGSILYDAKDRRYHMFAAEMANDCGIDFWEPNSRVVHAVADGAEGPYSYVSTVLERLHTSPMPRAPDGSWVIYMTLRHPPGKLFNCSSTAVGRRRTSTFDGPPPRHTYMVHSPSPYGPWSTPELVLKANTSIWDNRTVLIDTNLAIAILPDSSAVGIWRKCENPKGTVCEAQCCTFPHLLTAKHWRAPLSYTPHSDKRIFAGVLPYGSEDPMLWLQPRVPTDPPGNGPIIHAILHDEQGPQRCTAIGRHAFSDDLGATWTYASEDAYNGSVAWVGGGTTNLYRRERPHMVVDSAGQPRFVSNGVQETTASDRSWTLVQPLGPPRQVAASDRHGCVRMRVPTRSVSRRAGRVSAGVSSQPYSRPPATRRKPPIASKPSRQLVWRFVSGTVAASIAQRPCTFPMLDQS